MSTSNVRQLTDHGVPVYPITDKSLVIGLQDVPFESYVVAWDGASTPVPANIPAGVVVTYNGTDYTGTLAAGSATAPYLYLVASASQPGEYDRYIVTHTGATYAWTPLGSTTPVSPVIADDLVTNDPSKALSAKQGKILGDKTSELEAKVDDLNGMKELYGSSENIQVLQTLAGYLAFGKYYNGGNYTTSVFLIPANVRARLQATIVRNRPTIDFATIFDHIPENGDAGIEVISQIVQGTVIDKTITENAASYLLVVTKDGTADTASPFSLTRIVYEDFGPEIEEIQEDVSSIDSRLDVAENKIADLELTQKEVVKEIGKDYDMRIAAYVDSGFSKIYSQATSYIRGYKVNGGEKYHITGILTNSPTYAFISFFPGETAPVVGDSVTVLLAYGNIDKNIVSYNFTATEEGWLLIGFRSSTVEDKYSGYDWGVYKSQFIEEEDALVYPGKLNAVVGDTLQLFYRGMAKTINTKDYDFFAKCRYGAMYPRYFEITPTAGQTGLQLLTLQMRNVAGQALSFLQLPINIVASPASPVSEKRILVLGDSLTAAGIWVHELDRRLTSSDAGTPTMPAGKNLTNIKFIGGMENSGTRYFGVGGWGWPSYATEGTPAFRFQVTGVSTIVKGAVYSNNGHQYTVLENNTTGGVGNILCSVSSSSDTPEESGTLTRVSGSGDASITFTSASADEQNPLWDGSGISFSNYVSELGEFGLDCVLFLLGWNDITPEQDDFSTTETYIKDILDSLHTDYPSAKAVLLGLQLPSLNGGMGANYGASGGYSDLFGIIRAVFNYNSFLRSIAEDNDYNGFVSYVDVACQFDSENNMPQSAAQVNTRSTTTELRGTNGVHPTTDGQMQIADAAFRWMCGDFLQ